MSVPIDLNKIASEYRDIIPGASKAEEFLGKVSLIAASILEGGPSSAPMPVKAKKLAEDFFAAKFTPGQVEVLRTSSDPLLHETAKYLAIENYLAERFPAGSLGGCSVVIMRAGETLFSYASGLVSEGHVSSPSFPQHFGSVSKQFTAACIADLVIHGKIDLRDDIRRILPHLPQFTYRGKPVTVTVDDLLKMQSGLPDCVNLAFLRGIPDEELSQEEKMAPLFANDTLELAFEPGSRFHYCNSNYYLLSDIVKAVSGKDLRTYAHEVLFESLGMSHTDYIDPAREAKEQTIAGFAPDGREVTTKNKTWGPCGVIGTAEDMILWDARAPTMPFWSLLTEDPSEGPYSRGLHIEHEHGYRVIHHPGGIEGFQTMYLRLEEMDHTSEISIFLASNRDGREADVFAREIANLFLEKTVFTPPPVPPEDGPMLPAVVRDPLEMMEHVGKYHSSMLNTTSTLELVEEEGRYALKMKPIGADDRFSFLFAQDVSNPHKFISIGGPPGAAIVFSEDGFVFEDLNVPIPPIYFSKVTL